MKLSNPFAGVRNFIRTNESGRIYPHFTPSYERPFGHLDDDSSHSEHSNLTMPMQDKSLLLRPLSDTHLIEVYHEAQAMRLSKEFITLIEQALEQRGLSQAAVDYADGGSLKQ